MKNTIYTFILLFAFTFIYNAANAQFQIRNDAFIQIGYEDYRTLSFGEETNQPNNGKYAIEYWSQAGGLNFWKPWPTPNFANYVLFLRDDKNIGMGTAGSNAYRLDVNGDIRCQSISFGSDRRLKKNIQPLTNSLEKIMQLNAVTYDYDYSTNKYAGLDDAEFGKIKANTMKDDDKLTIKDGDRMGFIAQEVQEVMPQIVTEDENGMLALNYVDLIPVLTEAIKEQQAKIEKLEKDIASLKGVITQEGIINNSSATLFNKQSALSGNTPNPFGSQTTLEFYIAESDLNKTASITIYDSNGKEVFAQPLEITGGEGKLELNTSALANGTYFYSLMLDGQVIDSKTMLKSAR